MRIFIRMLTILLSFIIIFSGCTPKPDITNVTYIGFGGQQTISGSFHMIQDGDKHYVIDAGSFYGDEYENTPLPPEIDINKIHAVFLTHAHADHIGRLPLLLEKGYTGPIYMTEITYDIAKISLVSSIEYMDMGEEQFYYTKNNKSERKPVYLERFRYGQYEVKKENRVYVTSKRENLQEKHLYLSKSTIEQLEFELLQKLEEQVRIVEFDEQVKLDNISAKFLYSSHLPGSAMIKLQISDHTLLFSGDVGSDRSPFLKQNHKLQKNVDFLFVEGTYGNFTIDNDKRADIYSAERLEFRNYIGEAVRENQRVIIPAFVIDRTQQVLYEIKKAMEDGLIPSDTPVKVYSPSSERITELYRQYSENKSKYHSQFSETMFTDIFNIPNLIYNPKGPDNLYDLDIKYGEIAVMSSGMMSSVFSYEAAKMYVEDGNTHFIFVGYQDPDELGGNLTQGNKQVMIDDIQYETKANIFDSKAFSGHGDLNQIFDVFKDSSPDHIFIVHLNATDIETLQKSYEEFFPNAKVNIPNYKEEYLLFSY